MSCLYIYKYILATNVYYFIITNIFKALKSGGKTKAIVLKRTCEFVNNVKGKCHNILIYHLVVEACAMIFLISPCGGMRHDIFN